MGRHGHAYSSHTSLSNLGVNTGIIWGMRVNIYHSERGTCNSQFSKWVQGVDLNIFFRRYSYRAGNAGAAILCSYKV